MSKKILSNKGTLIPSIANLVNQCIGMKCKYRIVTEESLRGEDDRPQPSTTMTIVIEPISGKLLRNYWGNAPTAPVSPS
jgi:hypothetical protein